MKLPLDGEGAFVEGIAIALRCIGAVMTFLLFCLLLFIILGIWLIPLISVILWQP
jgi:hypothetical protein